MAGLTKRYGAVTAVRDLSLEVQTGEILGLLGPNGAGKSTTLSMLAGLTPRTAGMIAVFGRDMPKKFLEIAPRMGVLMERPAFYEFLSVRRNLKALAALSQRDVTLDRVLDMTGLLPLAGVRVGRLSAGSRQRLGLAQALLTEPELLLLDEPARGLDVEASQEVFQLLRRLADDAGVTVVVSSHMLQEVESLCDRVAVLNRGSLVACEATADLLLADAGHVEVVVDALEAAAKRLREQPWVTRVEQKSGRLHVALADASAHQLNAFLVGAGYKVSALVPRRRTLREYFLRIMNQ